MSRAPSDPFIGALLRFAWQGIRDHIAEAVEAAGYDDINPAHVALFRHPTLDGSRPSELAEALMISKQSINDLLGDLERSGYITRHVDPSDRRGRVIRLTEKGTKLEDTVRLAARDAERRLERDLGRQQFRSLKKSLSAAARVLNGNGSV
jgi:DNA-binding MarR family transcriptional regulator